MINYNVVVRALSDWTSTNTQGTFDQTSIAEGWGGCTFSNDPAGYGGLVNVRQRYIQGISVGVTPGTPANVTGGVSFGIVPSQTNVSGVTGNGSAYFCTRRYQINFALGLFTQDKLVSIFLT